MNTQPLAPVTPGAASVPSQDDRALAAFAHLSFLTGLWLIAPIAIYFLKRKESRFVAFHALQAIFVQLLWSVAMTCCAFALIVVTMAAAVSGVPALAILISFVPFVGILGAGLGLLAVHALAAYWAWCGREGSIPIAGRLARAVLGADEGAARA